MWCDYELFRVKLFPRLTYSNNEVTDLVKYTLSGANAEVILTDHLTHVSTNNHVLDWKLFVMVSYICLSRFIF